ncbi:hypothetical protein [Halovulum sp. GXIMD14793]
MPAPLAPIAATALRLGTVVAVTWVIARRAEQKPKHVWREAALDDCPEGVEITKDKSEAEQNLHGNARLTRHMPLPGGKVLEVDLASITRIRLRWR